MDALERDYPDVTFVYMTGHLDGSGIDGNLNRRNEQIRAFVRAGNKTLFDFADIESYDPDGNYYLDRGADDGCNYDSGNWATDWQEAHEEGVDWYRCSAAHTQPLNANLKAYAAWWLWARLGGWNGTADPVIPGLVPLPGYASPPTDPDGDGLYEDLNANGRTDFADVVLYFTQIVWIAGNEPVAPFDLNGNGRIDFGDVVSLFAEA
jgi:PKD repeat protein